MGRLLRHGRDPRVRGHRLARTLRVVLVSLVCLSFLIVPTVASAGLLDGLLGGVLNLVSWLLSPSCNSTTVSTDGQNTITWSTPQAVDSYEVQAATNSYFTSSSMVGDVKVPYPTNHYSFTGLTVGKTYYYRVRSIKGNNCSSWSNTVYAVYQAPTPVNQAPVAVAGAGYTAMVGVAMTLDGSLSHDADGRIVKYEWGFDQSGSTVWRYSSTSPFQATTFTSAGSFKVTLRVTDDNGATATESTYVNVTNPDSAPLAAFTAPTSVSVGDIVNLDASASFDLEGPIASYMWDFESDNTYDLVTTNPIVQHVWSASANVNVTLTVKDGAGNVGSTSVQISVLPIADVAPDIPTGLTAVDRPNDEGGAIALAWNANQESDLAGYRVYRATSVDGPYVLVADVGLNRSYTDSGLTDGTHYWYVVTAYDGAGHESLFSASADTAPLDNLAPATPIGLTLTDVPADQGDALLAAWDANTEPDLAGYALVVSGPTGTTSVIDVPADQTSYTIEGLTPGAVYRVSLGAHDELPNNSEQSAEVVGSPVDNLAPDVPTGVIANVPDSGEYVEISWAPNAEADLASYSLWRATSASGPYSQIGTTTSTHLVDSQVAFGSTYYYVVCATDTHDNVSNPSDPPVATLPVDRLAPTAPGTPVVIDISPDEGGAIRVSWPANTEADLAGYKVSCYDANGSLLATRDVGNVTTEAFSALPVGAVSADVLAYDTHGNDSAASSIATGTALDELAPTASSIEARDHAGDNGGAIDVGWTPSGASDFHHFTLYRSTSADGPWSVISDDLTALSYRDDSAALGVTLFYAVTASDVHGNESARATASATSADDLAPAAPTGVSAVDAVADAGQTDEVVRVSWTASADPDIAGYRIVVRNAFGGEASTTDVGLADSGSLDSLSADADYDVWVVAYDAAANVSDPSSAVRIRPTDAVAPARPSGFSVADVPNDQGGAFTVSWDANTEADLAAYTITMTAPDGTASTVDLSTDATSRTFSGLVPDAPYRIELVAHDTHGNVSDADVCAQAVGTDNLPPNAPAGLTTVDHPGDNGGAIDLSWDAVPDASQYTVYVDGVSSAVISGTSFTDSTAATGVPHSYTVTAMDAAMNESAPSAPSTAASADDLAPAVPTGLVAEAEPRGGAVTVSWDAVPDAIGYKLYRDGTEIADVATTGYVDSGLTNGTTYTYAVAAYDVAGNLSAKSDAVTATVADVTAPSAPMNLVVADVPADNGGATAVSWDAVSDAVSYTIYRDGLPIASGLTSTSYTDATAVTGTTYSYTVTATDASGNESIASDAASAASLDNVAPTAPTGVGAVDAVAGAGQTNEVVRVSWASSSDPDIAGYRIVVRNALGGAAATTDVGLADSGTIESLSADADYDVSVVAYDAAGNVSDPSSAVRIRPTDAVAPARPSGFSVADVPNDQGGAFTVSWDANTEADVAGYALTLTAPDGTVSAVDLSADVTSRTLSGLLPNEPYRVDLVARDTHGNVSDPDVCLQAVGMDNLPPAAPANLVASDHHGDNGGQVDVSWDAVPEAVGYMLYVDGMPWVMVDVAHWTYTEEVPGAPHAFTVTAFDAAYNESEFSNAMTIASADDLAPAIPAGLAATADVHGEAIALAWDAVSDAVGYKLYRDGVEIADVSGTSYADSGLADGTAHSYTVAAYDAAGNVSAASDGVTATPADLTAPNPPTNLTAADVPADNGGSVTLSWDAVSDATSYTLYRDGLPIASGLSSVSYTDATAITGTTYSYAVSATDAAGNESAASAPASAASLDNVAPSAPTGLTATDTRGDNGGNIDVAWSAVADATNYTLYRDGTALASGLTATTYTDASATTGTSHTYAVVAIDAARNESAASDPASATAADDLAPAVPGGLTAQDVPADEGGSIAIAWSASASGDADSYRVYRDGIRVATDVTSTNYIDTTAETDTWYAYTVTAIDAAGNESAPSAEAVAASRDNIAPAAPTDVTAVDTANDNGGSIDVAWSPAAGAATYAVYRDGVVIASGVTTTGFTDLTAATGISFSYTVTASDGAGNESAHSSAATATSVDDLALTLPLAVPAGVTAADPRDHGGALSISWQATSDARVTHYRVLRSTTSGSGYVQVGETNELQFTDTGLVNGTTYYYVVRGLDGAGNQSADSAQVSAVPVDNSQPTVTRYENTNPNVVYTSGWLTVSSDPYASNASGGSLTYATSGTNAVANSTSCSLTFTGSRATWVGLKAVNRGIGAVYIDGIFTQNVDCYSATAVWQASLYTSPVLSNGTHTIKIVYTGTKNAAATGTYAIDVDAIDVTGPVPDVDAPSVPTGVAARPEPVAAGGALRVSWNVVTAADLAGYNVYRAPSADGPFTKVATLGKVTSWVDTGLQNGTRYYYKVAAFDTSGNTSDRSAVVSSAPFTAPSGVVAANHPSDEGTGIDISWNANPESCVVGYKVFRATSADGYYVEIADVIGATTYSDQSVAKLGTEYYKVVAHDAAGNYSAQSAYAWAKALDELAPPVPTINSVVNGATVGGGSLTVSWTGNTSADMAGYNVYRSESGGAFTLVARLGNVTSLTDSGLTNGVAYTYAIAARDTSNNESTWSSTVSGMPFSAPGGLVVSDHPSDNGSALDVAWNASTEACVTGYNVYRSTTSWGSFTLIATLGNVTHFTDVGLSLGATRYYRVAAVDGDGNTSAQTDSASATAVENVPPAVPTSLTARKAPYTSGQVGLAWTADSEPDLGGYKVFRSLTAEGPYSLIASVGKVTTYLDTGLVDGNSYYYRIAAFDTSNNLSAPSATTSMLLSATTTGDARYENTDSHVSFTSGWVLVDSGAYGTGSSGGSLDYATSATSAVPNQTAATLTFTGTYATWIGLQAANRGIAGVYVDGVFQRNVDCYAATTTWQVPLYTTALLPVGQHTLKIVYTGTKNASASGNYAVDVDGFDVMY